MYIKTIYIKKITMNVFNKRSLVLKETTYQKKNVVLKEADQVGANDISGLANSLNQNNSATMTPTPKEPNQATIVAQKGKDITTSDLMNDPVNQGAVQTAQKASQKQQPTNFNVVRVNSTDLPTNNVSIHEGVVFTKREMSDFLSSI